MARIESLQVRRVPYTHWVADNFIDRDCLAAINATWPRADHPGWRYEQGKATTKASMLFPLRLPDAAHELAAELFSPEACQRLSDLVGMQLQPDPWFTDGPFEPRLGGGLHEIYPGGLLKVHVDFEKHPAGLRRVANLLIYLNEDWRDEWGGCLELHGKTVKSIAPVGGRAVLFVTDKESWHGHPAPLTAPKGRTRRSLALYYYTADAGEGERAKTVYRKG